MSGPDPLPSALRLAWLLFMQPLALHQLAAGLGIDSDVPVWRLWRANQVQRQYALRLLEAGLVVLLLGLAVGVWVVQAMGLDFNFPGAIAGVAVSLAGGVVFGVIGGVAGGLTFGVAFGVAGGVASGLPVGVAMGVAGGVAMGVAGGVALGVAFGLAGGVARGAAVSVLFGGALCVALGMAVGAAWGVAWGVGFGWAFGVAYFRLWLYPVEMACAGLALALAHRAGGRSLRLVPPCWHDLSYLPLPFLQLHLEALGERFPGAVGAALLACERTPGQRGIARRVRARLMARELTSIADQRRFTAAMHLQGAWLPPVDAASAAVLAFREVARHIEAARLASTAQHRARYLTEASRLLESLPAAVAEDSRERSDALAPVVGVWRQAVESLKAAALAEASLGVPDPFDTQPLNPDSGGELFVGREGLIAELEALLADPRQRNAIALLGPRRCGKSSLLKMLPVKLPDAVPVFFDVQDNPSGSAADFFAAVARRCTEQARRERHLSLPALDAQPDVGAFAAWLEQVDEALGNRRLLLCIDEFERLPELFPGDRTALLQLMGVLRATVQNRRNLRLMVAGVAPFDELDAVWSDHFINLRELRVEHLPEAAALALLTRPIPGFTAIPEVVARQVMARTGRQPLLLQLYGGMLVRRLNDDGRSEATQADVDVVDRRVIEEGDAVNHFRNLFDSAPTDAQAALQAFAQGELPALSKASRRYLLRRCLITQDGQPGIPVFFDWIQAERS